MNWDVINYFKHKFCKFINNKNEKVKSCMQYRFNKNFYILSTIHQLVISMYFK